MKKMVLKPYKIKTDTTRFLVPLLQYKRTLIETKDFINAYLYVQNLKTMPNTIQLVYKKENTFLETIKTVYKYTVDNYIVYSIHILNIKFNKFIKGKYSKFETSDKQLILDYWNLYKHTRMYNILNPKDFMYEIAYTPPYLLTHVREIWPKPNPLRETFIIKTKNN